MTTKYSLDLTDREAECLRLVAWGYTRQYISDKLLISIKSVETYMNSSFAKLGAKNSTEAVYKMFINGLWNHLDERLKYLEYEKELDSRS